MIALFLIMKSGLQIELIAIINYSRLIYIVSLKKYKYFSIILLCAILWGMVYYYVEKTYNISPLSNGLFTIFTGIIGGDLHYNIYQISRFVFIVRSKVGKTEYIDGVIER